MDDSVVTFTSKGCYYYEKNKKTKRIWLLQKKKIVPFKRLSWFFTSLQTNKVCLNPTNISFWKNNVPPQAPKISVFLLFMRLEKNKTPKKEYVIVIPQGHPSSNPTYPHHPRYSLSCDFFRARCNFSYLGTNEGHREGHQPEAKARVFCTSLGDGLGMVFEGPKPCVIQVQTLPLEAPVILRGILFEVYPRLVEGKAMGFILSGLESPSLEKRMSNHT